MKNTPLFVLLALFIAASCAKNNTPQPDDITNPPGQPAGTPVPNLAKVVKGFLLKACDIKLIPGGEYRIDYTWNTDSSLARYQSRIAGASDATDVDFHYSQNQLSRITTENSIYVGEYHFENGIVKRLTSRNTTIPTGRNYYFGYHADSSVQTLTYKNFNEAGEHLQQTVRYQYAADKRLAEITNTQPNGHKRVIRISKWSEPFYFSPWIFSSSQLDQENYELFNVPVLFRMDRMPAEFSVYNVATGGAEVLEYRWEIAHNIQNERLIYRKAQVTYPGNPSLNRVVEHTFHY